MVCVATARHWIRMGRTHWKFGPDHFGLASYYRLMGEKQTAEAICTAVVNQVYSGDCNSARRRITAAKTFRAFYLRAMAIWGIWLKQIGPIPGAECADCQLEVSAAIG